MLASAKNIWLKVLVILTRFGGDTPELKHQRLGRRRTKYPHLRSVGSHVQHSTVQLLRELITCVALTFELVAIRTVRRVESATWRRQAHTDRACADSDSDCGFNGCTHVPPAIILLAAPTALAVLCD